MSEVSDNRVAGTPGPTEPEGTRSGVVGWISGVFLDPSATFAAIRESVERPHPKEPGRTKDMSKWWLPLVISIVIGIGVALYTVPTFVVPMQADAIRESVVERGGSPADAERAIEISSAMTVPMSLVGVAIGTFIIVFITAGITHLLMKMVGGKGHFRHARAVVSWSMLISALGSLVKLPLMIVRHSMIVETSPTLLIRSLEPSDKLFKLLNSFDIFTIWWMVVMLLGLAAAYRASKGKAAVAIAVIWIVMIVIAVFTPGGMGAGM